LIQEDLVCSNTSAGMELKFFAKFSIETITVGDQALRLGTLFYFFVDKKIVLELYFHRQGSAI
jgi:hypothetical protein